MTLSTFTLYTLLALALGSFVGLERQWHRRLVDLKTNALVSMGAALFMMTAATGTGYVEPIRMAAQIVVGVGFLGGGLLFREGVQTRGINTAATLWCSAAIGTLCGLGRPDEATVAAVLLVAANTVLRNVAHRLELRMGPNDSLTEQLTFDTECDASRTYVVRTALEQALLAQRGELRSAHVSRTARGTVLISIVAAFESPDLRPDIEEILKASESWGVASVSWRRR